MTLKSLRLDVSMLQSVFPAMSADCPAACMQTVSIGCIIKVEEGLYGDVYW